jgi:2-polyprenyl-3-methyl-5-hydroxy-6-metoxy-1,4-benzoquinol methylase
MEDKGKYWDRIINWHRNTRDKWVKDGNPRQVRVINETIEISKDKMNCIDLGCGSGVIVEYLNKNGVRCRGVDISPKVIEYAKLCHDGVFDVANIVNYKFKEKYDVFILNEVVEYLTIPERKVLFDNIYSNANSGASIICTMVNPDYVKYLNSKVKDMKWTGGNVDNKLVSVNDFINHFKDWGFTLHKMQVFGYSYDDQFILYTFKKHDKKSNDDRWAELSKTIIRQYKSKKWQKDEKKRYGGMV